MAIENKIGYPQEGKAHIDQKCYKVMKIDNDLELLISEKDALLTISNPTRTNSLHSSNHKL